MFNMATYQNFLVPPSFLYLSYISKNCLVQDSIYVPASYPRNPISRCLSMAAWALSHILNQLSIDTNSSLIFCVAFSFSSNAIFSLALPISLSVSLDSYRLINAR